MGYIYILTSPSGKSYIGQTTRPIEKRFEQHQQSSSRCVAIYNAIQYHGWDNFEKDWYECPDEDLNFDEELLVREMGTLAPGGYNLKEGGGNGKPSETARQKMIDSKIGEKNPMWGKITSEETRQKQSEAQRGDKHPMYGKPLGELTKQKMSESKLGEKNHMWGDHHKKETKQKISDSTKGEKNHKSKRVYQYDLEGNLIYSFGSTREAGRYFKNDGTNIRACARSKNRNKTAHGFKWSYINVTE
jgi:group I intron endonuclease